MFRPSSSFRDFTGLGKIRDTGSLPDSIFNPSLRTSPRVRAVPRVLANAPSIPFSVSGPKKIGQFGVGFFGISGGRANTRVSSQAISRSLPSAITQYGSDAFASSRTIPVSIPQAITTSVTDYSAASTTRTVTESGSSFFEFPFVPVTPPRNIPPAVPLGGFFGGFNLGGRGRGGYSRRSRAYRPSRTIAEVTFNLGGELAKSVPGGYTGLEITRSYARKRKTRRGRKK